jgi:hypothetical protein
MLPLLSSPFAHFFLPSVLFFTYRPYSLGNTYAAQMFISAHLGSETVAGIVSAAKVRGDPGHHPGLHTRCAQSQASIKLAASVGVETDRLQRPSLRASSHARHPILSASFDESGKAQRRRPHLYDGVLRRPGMFTGHLHQHQSLRVTQHPPSVSPSLSTAPSGKTSVSRKRHSAMSHLRATATIPIRLTRLPPLPKRSRNHTLRALSG